MEFESCRAEAADGSPITFSRVRGPVYDAAVIICPSFFQDPTSLLYRRLAGLLAEHCNVLCVDFRGRGDSATLQMYSDCEDQDLEAVYRWAQTRYEKIGLIGFSLGAAAALRLAARVEQISMLVTVSAPSAFEDMEFKSWAVGDHRTDNPLQKKDRPVDSIRKLSGVPVLVIHGAQDATLLPVHARRLYEAAPEPKRLLIIDEGWHAEELFLRAQKQFLPPLRDWIKTTLLQIRLQKGTIQHVEGYPPIESGIFLYRRCWKQAGTWTPLVLLHDLGDHSGRYLDTGYRLARGGSAVYAFDLPGHGRTPGLDGHVKQFDDYLQAVEGFLRYVAKEEEGRKPVLVGHGLGGLIATLFAAEHPDQVAGLVCLCPLWALPAEHSPWRRALVLGLSRAWPSVTLRRAQIKGESLSRDPQAVFQYSADPLVHAKMSVRLETEIERQLRALPWVLSRLDLPLLVMQASEDRLVSARGVKALFDEAGSQRKQFLLYTGYLHDLLNEHGKERVFLDLQEWLKRGRMETHGRETDDA